MINEGYLNNWWRDLTPEAKRLARTLLLEARPFGIDGENIMRFAGSVASPVKAAAEQLQEEVSYDCPWCGTQSFGDFCINEECKTKRSKMTLDNVKTNSVDILEGTEDDRPDPKFANRIGLIPFAYHSVPPRGLAKVAAVMRKGDRKGRGDGWRRVPIEEQINHAIAHLVAYLGGRHNTHHLANAACRVLMALDLDDKDPLPDPLSHDDETIAGSSEPYP